MLSKTEGFGLREDQSGMAVMRNCEDYKSQRCVFGGGGVDYTVGFKNINS